jgi:hypothetical protein
MEFIKSFLIGSMIIVFVVFIILGLTWLMIHAPLIPKVLAGLGVFTMAAWFIGTIFRDAIK